MIPYILNTREKGEKGGFDFENLCCVMTYCFDAKEKEREREREKQSLIIVTPLLLLNVVIFFVVFVLCVNFYLLQIKKAENKLVLRVSVAYFNCITEGSTSKTPERPTRRLDCYWAIWRTTCSPRCERSFLNRPTLF